MRICEVSPYGVSQVSGITSLVLSLGRRFGEKGHPTAVVAPGPSPHNVPAGVYLWTVETQGPPRNLVFSVNVVRELWRRRREWEIVHVHQPHLGTLAAVLLARSLGKPSVATFHSQPPEAEGLRQIVQRFAGWLLPAACDARVFVSQETRREFGQVGAVIYNGVDVARIRSFLRDRTEVRQELGLEGFVVGFAGRKARNKGYHDLVEAVHRARGQGHDVRILAAGETPRAEQADLARRIRALGVDSAIIDLGPRENHLRYIAGADSFALPSYREGFPMGLLEAMALGLPILASPVGGIPELISDGEEGLLVQPGDVEHLADSITRLASNPALRARLGTSAAKKAQEYGLEMMVEAYLRVFQEASGT